jgi:hypothetical protein
MSSMSPCRVQNTMLCKSGILLKITSVR